MSDYNPYPSGRDSPGRRRPLPSVNGQQSAPSPGYPTPNQGYAPYMSQPPRPGTYSTTSAESLPYVPYPPPGQQFVPQGSTQTIYSDHPHPASVDGYSAPNQHGNFQPGYQQPAPAGIMMAGDSYLANGSPQPLRARKTTIRHIPLTPEGNLVIDVPVPDRVLYNAKHQLGDEVC